jgi:hypothetical protein
MYLSTTDYPSGQIIEFNLQTAKEKSHDNINAIYQKFQFKESLTTGEIYERVDNNDLWYVDNEETLATFVTKNQLELLHWWDKETLLPTDKQIEQLEEIGATSSSPYSLYADALTYPCKVLTIDRKKIDLCLIVFTKSPPLQRHYKNVLLFSEVDEIEQSELALTKELRRASTQVGEIRMAFAPFMVKTDKGKIITYDGVTHFASTGQISGKEIECEIPFEYSKFDKTNNVSFDDITFIIGKWDSRLENIFKRTRSEQEKQQLTGVWQNGGRRSRFNIWNSIKQLFKT